MAERNYDYIYICSVIALIVLKFILNILNINFLTLIVLFNENYILFIKCLK